MYIQYDELQSVHQMTLTGAQSRVMGMISFPNGIDSGIFLIHGEIMIMRDSDGAAKAWTFDSLLRRTSAGGVVILETNPSPPFVYATTADETALSGCTISLYSDSTQFGVTCTTIDGDIHWSVKLKGSLISRIDLPSFKL